mmetsp:Transcript_23618/g.44944  ORF Transcript_23618/g.44944 Transcript_23618/m.44944 type:complete len:507 (+) Transcript_23618:242-1762(+)
MSLRPNRASGGAGAPAYGGYAGAGAPGGYSSPGYNSGGASYYQQAPGAAAPYAQPSYGGGAYGGGGYNAGGGGYSSGAGAGAGGGSQGSYGGYSGGTPVYTGASSSSPSSSFKDKPKKKKGIHNNNSNLIALFLGALSILFMVSTLHFRGKCNQVLKETRTKSMKEALNEIKSEFQRARDLQMDKNAASRTERTLNRRISDLEEKVKGLKTDLAKEREVHSTVAKDFEVHREEVGHHAERLTSRDEAWANTVEVLQAYTQRESKRQALERFGPGPHHVRFTVLLPSDPEAKPRHFVVECAPLDLMPHAVHLFLEQVMHGLWNNAWFYLNGPHVLQGGPQAQEGEEDEGAAFNRFKNLGLDTLAFPEYSTEYPHVQFTLGYTGRPGGPDFYINKMNNTEAHGPGGQHQHSLEEFADACFAKVVDGYETLEMIFHEQTFPDGHEWGWFYVRPVHIVGATLLEQTPPPFPAQAMDENNDFSAEPEKQSAFPAKPLAFTDRMTDEHQVAP